MEFPHFRYIEHAMNRYMNAELAGMHFIYDLANGNESVAFQLNVGKYPMKRQPNHQTCTRVYLNLAEHGSFRVTFDYTPTNSEIDLMA
ncbi:hypothetical protein TNCV_1705361 [Trichonephila clavipes]|uniref:Uncharacterized protein n=1 Tax=Trichonephila clavipes TaxID=2585209 RepID=A0A8X6R694_TRICX|nr:hypothetical protein TNCV_1705361 [Trichonephila clavipes]